MTTQGGDAPRVAGEVFADQSLLPMCAVQALEAPIRFGMRDPSPDIAGTGERDERPPLAADKLAAMIVDELKLQHALATRQTYWKAQEDQTEAAGG